VVDIKRGNNPLVQPYKGSDTEIHLNLPDTDNYVPPLEDRQKWANQKEAEINALQAAEQPAARAKFNAEKKELEAIYNSPNAAALVLGHELGHAVVGLRDPTLESPYQPAVPPKAAVPAQPARPAVPAWGTARPYQPAQPARPAQPAQPGHPEKPATAEAPWGGNVTLVENELRKNLQVGERRQTYDGLRAPAQQMYDDAAAALHHQPSAAQRFAAEYFQQTGKPLPNDWQATARAYVKEHEKFEQFMKQGNMSAEEKTERYNRARNALDAACQKIEATRRAGANRDDG